MEEDLSQKLRTCDKTEFPLLMDKFERASEPEPLPGLECTVVNLRGAISRWKGQIHTHVAKAPGNQERI